MPVETPTPTQSLSPTNDQVKAGMRSTWISGDFGQIARVIEKDAITFAQRLNLAPGTRVLDVATGTGNLAIPTARQEAIVTGVDIAPNLLQQARDRAAAEHLSIAFDEGDAEALPYPDASFDAVITMFGAMFAPRPERVAAEFARVLRPGGTLAMANWTPGGFVGRMFVAGAKHVPPPPGIAPPVLWGDPITVHQRLVESLEYIRPELFQLSFDLPMSASEAVAFFRRYYGPTHAAFNRLNASGQQVLATDMVALWSGANVADNPEHHTVVPSEYLQVTATRNQS